MIVQDEQNDDAIKLDEYRYQQQQQQPERQIQGNSYMQEEFKNDTTDNKDIINSLLEGGHPKQNTNNIQ